MTGEWLTRAFIWLAMLVWTVTILARGNRPAPWAWGFGLFLYLVHIIFAYAHHYEWSHRVAWEATARDTEQATGVDSGIGLLVNYAFAAILAGDVFLQWKEKQRRWARWVDGLILFMIINGAIVFGEGPVRWWGIALVLAILVSGSARYFRTRGSSSGSSSPLP